MPAGLTLTSTTLAGELSEELSEEFSRRRYIEEIELPDGTVIRPIYFEMGVNAHSVQTLVLDGRKLIVFGSKTKALVYIVDYDTLEVTNIPVPYSKWVVDNPHVVHMLSQDFPAFNAYTGYILTASPDNSYVVLDPKGNVMFRFTQPDAGWAHSFIPSINYDAAIISDYTSNYVRKVRPDGSAVWSVTINNAARVRYSQDTRVGTYLATSNANRGNVYGLNDNGSIAWQAGYTNSTFDGTYYYPFYQPFKPWGASTFAPSEYASYVAIADERQGIIIMGMNGFVFEHIGRDRTTLADMMYPMLGQTPDCEMAPWGHLVFTIRDLGVFEITKFPKRKTISFTWNVNNISSTWISLRDFTVDDCDVFTVIIYNSGANPLNYRIYDVLYYPNAFSDSVSSIAAGSTITRVYDRRSNPQARQVRIQLASATSGTTTSAMVEVIKSYFY